VLLGGAMAFAQNSEKTELLTPPLDGVTEKKLMQERKTLAYDNVREGDVLWEKKIWRVIDVREKMNLPFAYAEKPFFTLLNDAAKSGKIKAYSTENDKFTKSLSPLEVEAMSVSFDTISIFDPVSYDEKINFVKNDLDPESVKQFRIKELWYMDKESSTVKVRILGIAPIIDEYDDAGNFKFSRPLYWVYYPECREFLSHQQAFNFAGNDAAPTSWEDLLEQRFFSSYITKESNVYDRRIEDYLTGTDALMEGDKIKNDIFHTEHDMWSY
jgi:gliding motility associated protien GldN